MPSFVFIYVLFFCLHSNVICEVNFILDLNSAPSPSQSFRSLTPLSNVSALSTLSISFWKKIHPSLSLNLAPQSLHWKGQNQENSQNHQFKGSNCWGRTLSCQSRPKKKRVWKRIQPLTKLQESSWYEKLSPVLQLMLVSVSPLSTLKTLQSNCVMQYLF